MRPVHDSFAVFTRDCFTWLSLKNVLYFRFFFFYIIPSFSCFLYCIFSCVSFTRFICFVTLISMWFFFQKLWKKFIFTLSFISFPFLIFRQDSFMIACDFSHDSLIFFNVIHSHDSFICTWLICFRMSCKKKIIFLFPLFPFFPLFFFLYFHMIFFSHILKKKLFITLYVISLSHDSFVSTCDLFTRFVHSPDTLSRSIHMMFCGFPRIHFTTLYVEIHIIYIIT